MEPGAWLVNRELLRPTTRRNEGTGTTERRYPP